MAALKKSIKQLDSGKGKMHDLIEVDEWTRFGLTTPGMIIFIGRDKIKKH
jgi:hypothetical protein